MITQAVITLLVALVPAVATGSDTFTDASSDQLFQAIDPNQLEIIDGQGIIESFDLELAYTLIGQHATRSLTDSQSLLSGSFDIVGELTLRDLGAVGFLVEGGQVITHNHDESLSDNIGSGFGVNDDLDDTPIALTELWWTYAFEDPAITVTVGKLDPTAFFDANRVANDETAQFIATPLVNSPAVAFPDNGPGFVIRYDHVDPDLVEGLLYLQAGLANSAAVASHISLNTFSKNHLFTAVEAGWENDPDAPTTTCRLMVWHSNLDDTASHGLSISCDHDILEHVTAFARFSTADADLVDFERFVSAGCSIADPLGFCPDDHAAVAFAWADPTDPTAREETLVETYYAFVLDENITITADAQYILNPAGAPDDSDTAVFGFRIQFTTN